VDVRNAAGKGVGSVPVTVTLTDATLASGKQAGKQTGTIETPADGSALQIKITPTGERPSASITLDSPADRPLVREAVDVNAQRIVSTGGEKELTGKAETTARTAPGIVRVAKTDVTTGAALAGTSLRVTAEDTTSPAVGNDDKPVVGDDGAPLVVVTDQDGVATVPNLRTPQRICVTEVAPPAGYDESFDPAAPPSACGTVEPGATLELSITNVPNVPKAIPAGGSEPTSSAIAQAAVDSRPNTVLLAGLGMLLLFAAGIAGLFVRRRNRS